jgi:hypothetical protein
MVAEHAKPIQPCLPGSALRGAAAGVSTTARDAALRSHYLRAALVRLPRLLGAIDRNPFRQTYGCLDRQYWHYRTSDFPSEMYQEGIWPMALVYHHPFPGNRWHRQPRVRELAIAGLRFAAQSSHRDGSCDDYYPFERALGAAVFSLNAAAQTWRLLELDDAQIAAWLRRRADWLVRHDESGRLANHQALAALGLARVAEITAEQGYRQAAEQRLKRLLGWQSSEGWFEEYGGADPGYQTVTIDCLVQCRRLLDAGWLDKPIARGVEFCRLFLHPDHSYGGEYGSRGTFHFYPHGFELLAATDASAADLADGFLQALASGKEACFDDDRLLAHRLGNVLEAWLDWSAVRTVCQAEPAEHQTHYLPQAQLLVRRSPRQHTVISAARGGVFKHFHLDGAHNQPTSDAGLILETTDGRLAVSQSHQLSRQVHVTGAGALAQNGLDLHAPLRRAVHCDLPELAMTVSGPLDWARFECVTPLKTAILRLGMWSGGRWCRTLVRRLLQRRLITARHVCPIELARTIELLDGSEQDLLQTAARKPTLRITDRIELRCRAIQVRRMSFGVDHQAAYVAACGVYQDAVLEPWTDLGEYVAELNARRRVTIVREL